MFGGLPDYRAGEASRKTRPKERLVRRSNAEAPKGFNRQRQWRLKTIWLVLLTFESGGAEIPSEGIGLLPINRGSNN